MRDSEQPAGETTVAESEALKRKPQVFPANLFRAERSAPWWIAYVRSRQEKVLARYLLGRRVAYYLPQREQRARRRGRLRVRHLPLFPGYLFFLGTPNERRVVLESNLTVNLLQVADQAQLDGELRQLWRLQCTGLPLGTHSYIGPKDTVEIVEGPFVGYRGTVLRCKGMLRLVVSISFLGRSVAVELHQKSVLLLSRPIG